MANNVNTPLVTLDVSATLTLSITKYSEQFWKTTLTHGKKYQIG